MATAVATEFRRVYAEWVYRKCFKEPDTGGYAQSVLFLWDAMSPFEREDVKAEIMSGPQVVETQLIVRERGTYPMMICVVKWALPGTTDHPESGYPDRDPTWLLDIG